MPSAAAGLAALVGTAGTGASIGSLSGIAAANASLAWLGGGTHAAGVRGSWAARRSLAMSVPAVGLVVGGAGLLMAGDKARSKADKYAAKVDADVKRLKIHRKFAPPWWRASRRPVAFWTSAPRRPGRRSWTCRPAGRARQSARCCCAAHSD